MVKTKQTYSWTKSKIFNLIEKYEEAGCLWNCNIDDYKSREKRETAISSICKNLNITREQFSKKIHNLRNQFNYEAKKLYKRNIEDKDESKPFYYSKWEYFNALKFLKSVITPRPGFSSTGINYELQQISTNFPNDEIEELSLSGKSFTDEHDDNNVVITMSPPHSNVSIIRTDPDKKPTFENKELTSSEELTTVLQENRRTSESPIIIEERSGGTQTIEHHYDSPQIIEIQPSSCMKKSKLEDICCTSGSSRNERNEYDVFGEFVAAELKSLNNQSSRKKLKRKIMEAILEVATEDDKIKIN